MRDAVGALSALFGGEAHELFHQLILGLYVIRVERDTVDRADLLALWFVEVADALDRKSVV